MCHMYKIAFDPLVLILCEKSKDKFLKNNIKTDHTRQMDITIGMLIMLMLKINLNLLEACALVYMCMSSMYVQV